MNRFRQISVLTAALLAHGFAAQALAGDTVLLKPKFNKGEKGYVEVDRNITQKMSGPMGNMEFKMEQLYLVARQVKDVSDGAADLEMKFERAMQSFDSPMMDGLFDTDDPDNEDASAQIGTLLKPLVGMGFKMKIGADGEVKKVSGMSAIREKLEEEGAGSPLTGQMAGEFTDDRAKREWGDTLFALYPNKEVKPGDTWQKVLTDSLPRLGPVVFNYDCKLDRISEEKGRKVAVVTYTGTVKSDKSAKSEDGGHATLDGQFKGTAVYDVELGQFTHREQNGNTKISMAGPGGRRSQAAKDDDDAKKSDKKDADDEEDDAPAGPPMKLDLQIHQLITVMNDAQLKDKRAADAKKRAEAAKKAEADDDEEDDDAPAKPGKAKPSKDDDDDDD